ncbi:protein FAR1-RELATED SEQUENCE 5-like [Juglans microcarpa x Juglans regia]|uniref:protein FAR1-RELATED SEQUENCE 5-like n=1 Tax=Juglans microcarpa x Juglans regia TaxID=2249226 RepID=UPI001B7E4A93|nr:protein FAR1-RELATED SEQUENCE 5-like [Juglans microcarpa x Juglans regia]XP_040992357.1 protein FAR1-RELATED SEQUENCE 5-like [Juglans microcarpa x Juglans regia]XP_040992358.1 protein FAR1-RELATED SEQUENCE 5-like [Juglans microcarpa x Juglans regia]
MENHCGQAFDSDESEKCLQIESYVEHEFGDDDLSKNADLCMGKVDKIIEQPHESSSLVDNVLEPYVGMEFNSRDDAREFYIAYGRRTGFTVRIHHNRRSRINNVVIGQDFVCSKEGFREKKYVYRKDRVLPPPPITREGCAAMLRLALRDGEKWVVTKFVKEHNHTLLSPSKVPWRGSGKNMISEDEKDQRIRELTLELSNERQRCKRLCVAYQEQLHMVLKYIEEHTDHMERRVQDIVQNVREIENEQQGDSTFL